MDDPRIQELMAYADSVDENGEPTSVALIARRVSSYMEVVEQLREQVTTLHSDVEKLEATADNLSEKVEQQKERHEELIEQARVTATRASSAVNTGHGARMRKEAAEATQQLEQFEVGYAEEQKRLQEVLKALQARRQRLIETRDQIGRRMNIIDALLQRAEIEWPDYLLEENDRLKGKGQQTAGNVVPLRRRRGRGRTRVVRRRKAS